MSREIKFRVWDNYLKSYKDNYENRENDSEEFYLPPKMLFLESLKSLQKDSDRFTIEQFTGLKDKNGKEIYEGDIIRDGSSVYQVLFGQYEDGLSQQVGIGFYLEQTNGFFQPLCQNNKFTILGNIHENPELLK